MLMISDCNCVFGVKQTTSLLISKNEAEDENLFKTPKMTSESSME